MRKRMPEPGWMLMFADLAALLLAFFVLTFSMARIEEARWRQISKTIAAGDGAIRPAAPPQHSAPAPKSPASGIRLHYLAGVADRRLAELGRPFALRVEADGPDLVLRFQPRLLTLPTRDTGATAAVLRTLVGHAVREADSVSLELPRPPGVGDAERLRRAARRADRAYELLGRRPDTLLDPRGRMAVLRMRVEEP